MAYGIARPEYTSSYGLTGGNRRMTYLDQQRAQADELAQNYMMREQQLVQGNLQMSLMSRQFQAQQEQARTAAQFAQRFLSQWNQSAAEAKGVFSAAMASAEDIRPYIGKLSAYGENIDELISDVQTDLATYKERYSPLESEAMETSRMALGAQRGMLEQLQELSAADYEGVTGRAKADVAQESERARRAEARSLQGVGLDPTSGRYRGSMRSSQVNEALNKVLASNAARMAEKNRVSGLAMGGLQVVDPAKMGGTMAEQIRGGARDYTQMIGGLAQTGAGIRQTAAGASGDLARTQAGIASSYSQTMMPQYGEAFMSMLGTGMATGPQYMQQVGAQAGMPVPPAQNSPAGIGGPVAAPSFNPSDFIRGIRR